MEAIRTAYMAGLFDGEGFIRVTKQSSEKTLKTMQKVTPSYHLCVGITNVNIKVIEMFKNEFGGYVYANKRDNRKICFQWVVYDRRAVNLVKVFIPYLIIKGEKTPLAIEFYEYYQATKSNGKRKSQDVVDKLESYFIKFKELNAKGSQWLVSHQQRLSKELQDIDYTIYGLDEATVRTARERVEASRNV